MNAPATVPARSLPHWISPALLIFTGTLFVLKYSSRVIALPGVAAAGYVCAAIGALAWLAGSATGLTGKITRTQLRVVVVIVAVMLIAALPWIPPATRVSRWVALQGWMDFLHEGVFPYSHPTRPSGFPVLFLVALPFRLLGDIGYMAPAGFLVFGLLVTKFAASAEDAFIQLSTVFILPTLYYEILVRSELLFNMSLALGAILLAGRLGHERPSRATFVFTAIAFGLLLSTRSVVVLVFGVYLSYAFRGRPGELMAFILIAGTVFVMTLVPFIVWDPGAFLRSGPFAVQLSYLPVWVALGAALVSLMAGRRVTMLRDCFFLTGCLLFAVTAASFLFCIGEWGWHAALYQDRFDISYFVFCTPFLLLSLTSENLHTMLTIRRSQQ